MNKWLWRMLGLVFVGCAYVGAIVPGVPMVTFIALAAWAFAKGSPELNTWLHTHPIFGPHLVRWETKHVYPTRIKRVMLICCTISYGILLYTVQKPVVLIGVGVFMLFWLIWAWRFPGSEEEYERRIKAGEKIGWRS